MITIGSLKESLKSCDYKQKHVIIIGSLAEPLKACDHKRLLKGAI